MATSDDSMTFDSFDGLLRYYFPRDWITVREEVRQACGSSRP